MRPPCTKRVVILALAARIHEHRGVIVFMDRRDKPDDDVP